MSKIINYEKITNTDGPRPLTIYSLHSIQLICMCPMCQKLKQRDPAMFLQNGATLNPSQCN